MQGAVAGKGSCPQSGVRFCSKCREGFEMGEGMIWFIVCVDFCFLSTVATAWKTN